MKEQVKAWATPAISAVPYVLLGFVLIHVQPASGAANTIDGNVQKSNTNFHYIEQKYGNQGGGNRGIRIYLPGGGRDQTYKFSPNPHNDKWYNKNQSSFYRQSAEGLADYYLGHQNRFPRYDTFKETIHGVQYTLGQP